MWKLLCFAALSALVACGGDAGGSGGSGGVDPGASSDCVSVACMLATVDTGDPTTEDDAIVDEFQAVIDCILSSGIEGAETEQKVGDTLYASWAASAQRESLLEWGQALCSG